MNVGLLRCVYVAFQFLILFFKQKTAYEMRISDWSSDVCSSDLPLDRAGRWERRGDRLRFAVPLPASTALSDPHLFVETPRQIGRASCRERVVSVRVDLGGRRLIQKEIYY